MLVFSLKTHKHGESPPQFYIQSKGLHAGRPLKRAIPNCFSVYCESPAMYGFVYALYIGGFFKFYIRGSVVPFITVKDTFKVLNDHSKSIGNSQMFEQIMRIEELISTYKAQIKLYNDMRRALCHKALK